MPGALAAPRRPTGQRVDRRPCVDDAARSSTRRTTLIAWADRRLAYDGVGQPDAVTRSDHELHAAASRGGLRRRRHRRPGARRRPGRHRQDHRARRRRSSSSGSTAARVFGVAPSANAAEVLAGETGLVTDTLDKLLIEHRLPRGPRPQFDLPVGTTVIVDEAGMVPDREARRAGRARRREGLADRARRRPAPVLRRRPRRHVRAARRHVRRDRARPRPPLRTRVGTRRQPPPAQRRRHGRRRLRRPRPAPRRHRRPDGTSRSRQVGDVPRRRQVGRADGTDQRSRRTAEPALPARPDPARRTRRQHRRSPPARTRCTSATRSPPARTTAGS